MNDPINSLNVSDEAKKRIFEWTNPPYDEECINEIKSLVENKAESELQDRFYTDLDFGTGGLRGVLGFGTNRMNIYTVKKATQGLCNYINTQVKENPSIAVAYDSRNYSREFAQTVAQVAAGNGIKCYLFESMRPTPVLSFAILHLKASSGVVITASHNPPEYNGYKAYWSDGVQVTSPHDKAIIQEAKNVKSINNVKTLDMDDVKEKGLCEIIGTQMDRKYLDAIGKLVINPEAIKQTKDDVKIVYTSLHGAGIKLIPQAFAQAGFNEPVMVDEQIIPDGNFPTVNYPNPEEKEALTLAIKKAEETGAELVLATDPDADRMGAVYRDNEGNYILLNGNEIGSIMTYYILSELKKKDRLPQNGAIVKTIVTTDLQNKIAESFNIKVFEVLTGFKHIGSIIHKCLQDNSYRFLYGGEESYGYLNGDHARDKDGVSACILMAEICHFLKARKQTLGDYLVEIYAKNGYYKESLISIVRKGEQGVKQISSLMGYFRKNLPVEINQKKIIKIHDCLEGYSFYTDNPGEKTPLDLPKSNVLQFYLEDGSKISMRPSGTEPKVKFYFSCTLPVSTHSTFSKKDVLDNLKNYEDSFIKMINEVLDTFS